MLNYKLLINARKKNVYFVLCSDVIIYQKKVLQNALYVNFG